MPLFSRECLSLLCFVAPPSDLCICRGQNLEENAFRSESRLAVDHQLAICSIQRGISLVWSKGSDGILASLLHQIVHSEFELFHIRSPNPSLTM